MGKIAFVVFAGLAFGLLLTLPGISWLIRPGWLGAAALVGAAYAARRHWDRRDGGYDPAAPERETWHALAGSALVGGHARPSNRL